MRYLITGGAGFIGSAFIRYLLKTKQDIEVVNFDALTYAGNLQNLSDIEQDKRYQFVKGDICDSQAVAKVISPGDTIVHFAAESHNDRGILDPGIFFKTNVVGTQTLLEACRQNKIHRFHHISTCEVFGDLALNDDHAFKESDPFLPRTPYNASKAGSVHAVMAYYHTFGLPVTVSHCCNNYGPYKFPEKIIPLFTTNALEDKPLPLFKSSQNRREWIHVDDHSAAVDFILQKGRVGEAYNIGTGVEKSIDDIADLVLNTLGKPLTLKTSIADRQGHDRRYLLDITKIASELNWSSKIKLEQGIVDTINWYRDHIDWWKNVKSGAYRDYYNLVYNSGNAKK